MIWHQYLRPYRVSVVPKQVWYKPCRAIYVNGARILANIGRYWPILDNIQQYKGNLKQYQAILGYILVMPGHLRVGQGQCPEEEEEKNLIQALTGQLRYKAD